jgi:hypothetical protein
MQSSTLDTAEADDVSVVSTQPESLQRPETGQYNQALAEIETQLAQLHGAFETLDRLKAEADEAQNAYETAIADEKMILADQNGTEKQAVDRLLKARALRDVREARLTQARKRVADSCDSIVYDIGQPLRHDLSNLAHALLAARMQRIHKLFDALLGVPYDSGLPLDNKELTRRSRPVVTVQQLCNWIHREARPTAEEELAELRSEVPRRWLSELRAIVEAEANQ